MDDTLASRVDAMKIVDTAQGGERAKTPSVCSAILWLLLLGMPSTAWASTPMGDQSVASYTALAVGFVIALAITSMLALKAAHVLHFIGGERRVMLMRQLRVAFGATFLLAAVTPYVALNFSATSLVPVVAGAGLVVIAWIWGASQTGDFDSEMSPPSEA